MAKVEKYTDGAVAGLLRHNLRVGSNHSNKTIDSSKTPENINLTPDRGYEYYKRRKSEVYCFGKKNITAAEWIVTAPAELDKSKQIEFLRAAAAALAEKYGEKNVISAVIHLDETTPHLHFDFLPVVARKPTKNHPQTEKLCAKELINRAELKKFHGDLQKRLLEKGVEGAELMINGKTKAQGGDRKVKDMKRITELERENGQLKERVTELERQLDREIDREDGGFSW